MYTYIYIYDYVHIALDATLLMPALQPSKNLPGGLQPFDMAWELTDDDDDDDDDVHLNNIHCCILMYVWMYVCIYIYIHASF